MSSLHSAKSEASAPARLPRSSVLPRLAAAALLAFLAASLGCSDLGRTLRPTAAAEVSPASLDFGTIATGDTALLIATVTNSGTADLSGSVSTSAAEFALPGGGGAFTLPPGQTMNAMVEFVPVSQGTFSGTLSFGSGNPSVSLAGVCQDPVAGSACDVSPTSLSFGSVTVGQSSTKSFVIRSVGSADLAVNVVSSCSEFQLTSGGGVATIVPGDSLVVSVRYAPTAAVTSNCTVSVGPGCPSVNVSGTGQTSPVSFAADIQPIFTASCAIQGCHTGVAPTGSLNLSAGTSYGQTVNVVSFGYAPALRVHPNDLSGSVLYGKITNSGQYGGGMPKTGSITSAQISAIAAWILQGAPNN